MANGSAPTPATESTTWRSSSALDMAPPRTACSVSGLPARVLDHTLRVRSPPELGARPLERRANRRPTLTQGCPAPAGPGASSGKLATQAGVHPDEGGSGSNIGTTASARTKTRSLELAECESIDPHERYRAMPHQIEANGAVVLYGRFLVLRPGGDRRPLDVCAVVVRSEYAEEVTARRSGTQVPAAGCVADLLGHRGAGGDDLPLPARVQRREEISLMPRLPAHRTKSVQGPRSDSRAQPKDDVPRRQATTEGG